ncbi:family 43 glycosylhydrolase [Paenibacillus silviterrae]|uniref:family 43 glycosylhydrolase n=1 Tax=Paenibacillus silviterrae TaxID=3242194 RepID=UPI002542CF03|nr:family 43 glycosylhydrolase [Paenibacillus chinjuensis]
MNGKGMYVNPVVAGNYADPSVIRVGEDYYMTHTSYKAIPGLIIWHSRDLVHWAPISAALYEYVGDVWAPEFVHHNGTYYIYFPANRTNWVVTAPTPTGPWSRPVDLKIKGIDPGHVVGPDGKRYLHMSDGHIVELSEDGLAIAGEPRHVYDGWRYPDEWVVEGYSMEGPKLRYKDGYYYLNVAVGGTAGPPTSHMVVCSRSHTPWGPWEHSPYNPVVKTQSRSERWWSKGHGTLIDSPDGKWYIVYHGYLNGYHSLGRQTLLEPVEWTEDGWYRTIEGISPDNPIPLPFGEAVKRSRTVDDRFNGERLGIHWQCNGELPEVHYRQQNGTLTIEGRDDDKIRSPLVFMTTAPSYEAEVELSFTGAAEGRLLLYYDDNAWMGIGVSAKGARHLRSFKQYAVKPCYGERVFLRIRHEEHLVFYYYSTDGIHWSRYDKVTDASGFNHNTLGGFLSLRIGLDAVGEGTVTVHRFQYRELHS